MDNLLSNVDFIGIQNKGFFNALTKHFPTDPFEFSLWNVSFLIYTAFFVVGLLVFIYQFAKSAKFYLNYDEALMALHKATYENDTFHTLQLARKYPGAINKTIDPDLFTPFLRACYHGNTQVVKYMIQHGADVSSKTAKGESGFYLAIYNRIKNRQNKDASCIRTLYYAGCDIDETNINGLTAIQVAAMFGHTSLAKWLIAKCANLDVEPAPYILAKTAGHYETAELFRLANQIRF